MSERATPTEADQEKLRSLAVELRFLDLSLQEIQVRMGMIENAIRELTITNMTLEGVEAAGRDAEVLIPVGSGSFVKGRIIDAEKVILGVGAGVALEKTTKEAKEAIERQLSELQKAGGTLGQKYAQTLERAEAVRRELQKLASTLQQGSPEKA